ncbi:RTA1 like protein-domain-containing protein [Triangularia verruculosa]|uniref:RTA1 like protein-domain-containing protein n=1 Tax=Triangularia verruculosa TaxID=2587418 RepID=A0AAN6XEV7_9PEZI|nr:RTA1 like protein-domain-containing protein [Triangularia verruculosa]
MVKLEDIDPSLLPPNLTPAELENLIAAYYYSCDYVSLTCPVTATTLGYYPNRGINIFLSIGFGVALLATVYHGIRTKTWTYSGFVAAGCALELAGYISRIPLTDNPWNKKAFETQIVAIILAPTLLCISIYLTLKHVCLSLNPDLSRIRPRLYPFIFVPLDISCLTVQAIGGALAAGGAVSNIRLVEHGNRAIIAGIVLQVVVLGGFGGVGGEYLWRVKKWLRTGEAGSEMVGLWNDKKFRRFGYAVSGAYVAILLRCIYRIAEMAGGWGNHIMQDEWSFVVLEGIMVLFACLLLAFFPPGILFPQMAARMAAGKRSDKGDVERQTKTETSTGEQAVVGGGNTLEQSTGTDSEKKTPVSLSVAKKVEVI